MSNLPQETRDRIEADALTWSEQQHGHDEPNKDYLEGAATEAKRAQGLVEALELIVSGAAPYNQREMIAWIQTARQIASDALAKYKEVSNG